MTWHSVAILFAACSLVGYALHHQCEPATLAVVAGLAGTIAGGVFGQSHPSKTVHAIRDAKREEPTGPVPEVREG